MGEGRSACFKQTPSRKGDEWDSGVCSSVPLAHMRSDLRSSGRFWWRRLQPVCDKARW